MMFSKKTDDEYLNYNNKSTPNLEKNVYPLKGRMDQILKWNFCFCKFHATSKKVTQTRIKFQKVPKTQIESLINCRKFGKTCVQHSYHMVPKTFMETIHISNLPSFVWTGILCRIINKNVS